MFPIRRDEKGTESIYIAPLAMAFKGRPYLVRRGEQPTVTAVDGGYATGMNYQRKIKLTQNELTHLKSVKCKLEFR
jgi:hypothetical protein